jgi:hypothetical protein
MSLFSRLLRAVRSWRPRRAQAVGRRAGVAVEQLDHRQLLSVNFTGNVSVDFPATQSPGVVVLPVDKTNPETLIPQIPSALQSLINVSGFNIQDVRVSYDSTTDTLYVGIDQPASGNAGQGEVIAGDSDDNGNSGTVNPAVSAVNPAFTDPPDMGGSKYMGIFLDFTGSGVPQIVAGYSFQSPLTPTAANPDPAKPYEVAVANPQDLPIFGTWLTQFTGSVFLQNSPTSPNLEFSITHFSQLYEMETGKALTSSSVIDIGAQGGSEAADGISDMFAPEQAFTLSSATLPVTPTPTPTPCPPQSPTIYVNPHEHRIVDTLHRDLIRVTILGTSGFNVKDINPSTVTLDGVPAVAHITRKVRRDPFPEATYVFVANELHLAKGLNNVTLSGTLNNGTTKFTSSTAVLNIPYASQVARGPLHRYMGGGTIYEALAKLEKKHPGVTITSSSASAVSRSANREPGNTAKLDVSYAPVVHSAKREATPRPVVSLKRAEASPTDVVTKLPTLLRHSMNDYLDHAGSQASRTKARAGQAG